MQRITSTFTSQRPYSVLLESQIASIVVADYFNQRLFEAPKNEIKLHTSAHSFYCSYLHRDEN